MKELLYDLTMLNGIPAHEKEIKNYVCDYAKDKAEISFDKLGSVILKHGNGGPKIMVSGHMDEVGFIVVEITKDGYLKFTNAGSLWGHVVLAQQMVVTTLDGRTLVGVVGSKPPHILDANEKNKVLEINQMYLDLGVSSKEEVENLGIQIGDMITPLINTRVLANPKYLLGKAWDDRFGVACCLEVLDNIQNQSHPNTYFGVCSVQEEVGLRGAMTSAYKVTPDIGISLDVTIAYDYPSGSNETKLGKGPCLVVTDSSMIGHVGLRKYVMNLCKELNIPYQLSYLNRGGTDAGKIHLNKEGCPSIAICIPCRYLHSHTSIIHEDDYNNTVKLITEIIKRLDKETVDKITYE